MAISPASVRQKENHNKIGEVALIPGRRSAPLLPLLPSIQIGQCEVLYPLAAGGMASVHVARRLGLSGFERLVALKVVHPHLAQEPEFIHLFLDEARLAASIHHPNVGEVLEVGEDQGLFYMVSELVLGHDLRGLVRRLSETGERLSADLVAHIIGEVGRGLHAAHEATGADGEPLNLVHKDVTPRNILVSYDGAVKLIDFGVALARGRHTQSTVSAIQGKAGFVSPEVIRGDLTDRRSDIFSLGVVLYWLLTRTYPFVGQGQSDWTSRVLSGSFRRPRDIVPGIPPELESVVLRAMANAPEDRYANAALMADDLDAFIGGRRYRDLGQKLSCIIREHFSQELYLHEEQLRAARGIPSIPAPPPKFKGRDKHQRTPLGIEVMDIGPDGQRRIRWTGVFGILAGIAAMAVLTVAILPRLSEPDSRAPLAAPALSSVELKVKGVPDSAVLLLDGQRVWPSRVVLPREGDRHELELRVQGRIVATKTIVAQPGLEVDFSSHFEK